jgi:ferrous iron transport protein B
VPNPLNIFQTMRDRSWLFVKRAGTVILTISILLWAMMTFPRSAAKPVPDAKEGAAVQAMRETGVEARGEPAPLTAKADEGTGDEGEQLRQSYAGRSGTCSSR